MYSCAVSIINALGYMAPPTLQHLFVDNVWYAWGRNTSMKYLEETHIEHMHPIAEKAEWDDVYALGKVRNSTCGTMRLLLNIWRMTLMLISRR